MRGRKPLPKTVKLLQGTYAPSRDKGGYEPVPLEQSPPPPCHLSAGAKEVWRHYADRIIHLRFLTDSDLANFAVYCALIDRFNTTHQELTVPQLTTLANSISKLAGDFGFTPASRQRVQPIAKDATPEEKSKWFGSGDNKYA